MESDRRLRAQVYLSCRRARGVLVTSVAVLLSGCWTLPSGSVRPEGGPRVIASGIEAEWVADSARIESVDRAARTVALSIRGVPQRPCKVGLGLRHWNDIRSGDSVRATIKGTLTVYVPTAGEDGSPAAGVPNRSPDARVQVVDPSYRLLTVQYPNGGTQTFKLALHWRIKGIEAGDSVAIRPIEVIKLRAR